MVSDGQWGVIGADCAILMVSDWSIVSSDDNVIRGGRSFAAWDVWDNYLKWCLLPLLYIFWFPTADLQSCMRDVHFNYAHMQVHTHTHTHTEAATYHHPPQICWFVQHGSRRWACYHHSTQYHPQGAGLKQSQRAAHPWPVHKAMGDKGLWPEQIAQVAETPHKGVGSRFVLSRWSFSSYHLPSKQWSSIEILTS